MKRSSVFWCLSAACLLAGGSSLAAAQTPDVAREITDGGRDDWIYNGTREAIDAELPAFFGAAQGDYIVGLAKFIQLSPSAPP